MRVCQISDTPVDDVRAGQFIDADAAALYRRVPGGDLHLGLELPEDHHIQWIGQCLRAGRQPAQMLTAMGIEGFAERARRELLATGETVRKRSVEAFAELTAQETQIAKLARDGRTNQEISTQLFISARTVEWHLGNVFTKLGTPPAKTSADASLGLRATSPARRSALRAAGSTPSILSASAPRSTSRGIFLFVRQAVLPRSVVTGHDGHLSRAAGCGRRPRFTGGWSTAGRRRPRPTPTWRDDAGPGPSGTRGNRG